MDARTNALQAPFAVIGAVYSDVMVRPKADYAKQSVWTHCSASLAGLARSRIDRDELGLAVALPPL